MAHPHHAMRYNDRLRRWYRIKANAECEKKAENTEENRRKKNVSPTDLFEALESFQPQALSPSAFEMDWKQVTIRGYSDGTTVFKFGVADPPEWQSSEGCDMNSSVEEVCWQNALRLGVKFPHQIERSLAKLDRYVTLYSLGESIHPRMEMRHNMYRTYSRALKRLTKTEQLSRSGAVGVYKNVKASGASKSTKISVLTLNFQPGAQAKGNGSTKTGPAIEQELGNGNGKASISSQETVDFLDEDEECSKSINKKQTRIDTASSSTTVDKSVDGVSSKPSCSFGSNTMDRGVVDRRYQNPIENVLSLLKVRTVNMADDTTLRNNFMRMDEAWKMILRPFSLLITAMRRKLSAVQEERSGHLSGAMSCALQISTAVVRKVLKHILDVYRLLPYSLRSFLRYFKGREWPPEVGGLHASGTISKLLEKKESIGRTRLAEVGFDSQGRCNDPLSDIKRWQLELLVGCGVRNVRLYRMALTHPTALPPEMRTESYERLEYLGDAVMELCIRELLMERSPNADEGELTSQSQVLVNGTNVGKYGAWLGLDRWVLRNTYTMRDNAGISPYILGDAFEALLGALYVDRGLEAARRWLLRVVTECPAVDLSGLSMVDYKGILGRLAQIQKKEMPRYEVAGVQRRQFGEDGSKRKYWKVNVVFDGSILGQGSGFEKRIAEQEAAHNALLELGEDLECSIEDENN